MSKRLERSCWTPPVWLKGSRRTRPPRTAYTISTEDGNPRSLEPGAIEPGSLSLRLRRDSAGEQGPRVLEGEAPVALINDILEKRSGKGQAYPMPVVGPCLPMNVVGPYITGMFATRIAGGLRMVVFSDRKARM
jgi:hypothetical protein